MPGILLAQLEDDLGSSVGFDRLARAFAQLTEMLVGQRQVEPVDAGFGQHIVQGLRQVEVVVEFVRMKRFAYVALADGPPGPAPRWRSGWALACSFHLACRRVAEDYDVTDFLNANPEGWNEAMGLRFTKATADEVEAELDVGPQHLQAYGIVHGGVHCGVVETTCSIGAWTWARRFKLAVVGVENQTSFLHAVRPGARLRAIARPINRDERTQVWEANIIDDHGRLIAFGRVRLLCLPEQQELAGERLSSPLKRV